MLEWLFKRDDAKDVPLKDDWPYPTATEPPRPLDTSKAEVLDKRVDTPEALNPFRKEVKPTMPKAKERFVRYTGRFSFTVPSDDPGAAATILAAIRQSGTVSNVRSVNVNAPKIDDGSEER